MAELQASILVVDDDVAVAKVLCALLAQAGHGATTVADAGAALAVLAKGGVDLVITDVRMPGMDGFGLLAAVKEKWPEIPVALITAHGSVPMAVEAMKKGASDFLLKPFERDDILYVVNKALTGSRPEREDAPRQAPPPSGAGGMLGASKGMAEVQALLARTAPTQATVLLRGESGTGKELAARALHEQSTRAKGPFIRVHCAALPDTLLESELFGYEKGAFTGAATRKPGRVELADGGTLFLDEIGDITPGVQVKLLRLLQEREYERLGGTQTLKADVRFVAATHRNLEELVKTGEFREDLFYRLNVVPIWLPPLRERRDDVATLARAFCAKFARENGRGALTFDAAALARLEAHPWPGNVRQLQNFVERLVVLAPGPVLGAADVDAELARGNPLAAPATPSPAAESGQSLDGRRRDAEKLALQEALTRAGGNRTTAARLLGVSRRTLYNKLESLGLG